MSGTETVGHVVSQAGTNVITEQSEQGASGGSFVSQVKGRAKEYAGKVTGKEHEVVLHLRFSRKQKAVLNDPVLN